MTRSKLHAHALLSALVLALPGCSHACSPGNATDHSTAPVEAAVPIDDSPLTDAEAAEMRSTVPRERCEDIGRRYNVLSGRSESELHPQTVELVSACIRSGNLAWYKCTAMAKTVEEFDRCSARLLRAPP